MSFADASATAADPETTGRSDRERRLVGSSHLLALIVAAPAIRRGVVERGVLRNQSTDRRQAIGGAAPCFAKPSCSPRSSARRWQCRARPLARRRRPPPTSSLTAVALNVADLARSEKFYIDLLGLERTFRYPAEGKLLEVGLRAPDRRVRWPSSWRTSTTTRSGGQGTVRPHRGHDRGRRRSSETGHRRGLRGQDLERAAGRLRRHLRDGSGRLSGRALSARRGRPPTSGD